MSNTGKFPNYAAGKEITDDEHQRALHRLAAAIEKYGDPAVLYEHMCEAEFLSVDLIAALRFYADGSQDAGGRAKAALSPVQGEHEQDGEPVWKNVPPLEDFMTRIGMPLDKKAQDGDTEETT